MGSGDNPLLLFVHGGCFGQWCWEEHFLNFFTDSGFDCAAVSLRGHGASGTDRPLWRLSFQDYVDDVHRTATSFDRRPVLIGHSLGGTIVQQMARPCRRPPWCSWRPTRRQVPDPPLSAPFDATRSPRHGRDHRSTAAPVRHPSPRQAALLQSSHPRADHHPNCHQAAERERPGGCTIASPTPTHTVGRRCPCPRCRCRTRRDGQHRRCEGHG